MSKYWAAILQIAVVMNYCCSSPVVVYSEHILWREVGWSDVHGVCGVVEWYAVHVCLHEMMCFGACNQ